LRSLLLAWSLLVAHLELIRVSSDSAVRRQFAATDADDGEGKSKAGSGSVGAAGASGVESEQQVLNYQVGHCAIAFH
jgi:hypothetical protein